MVIKAVYGADLEEAYDASCMEQRIPGTHRMRMQSKDDFFFFLSRVSVASTVGLPLLQALKLEISCSCRILGMYADLVSKHKHSNGNYAAFDTIRTKWERIFITLLHAMIFHSDISYSFSFACLGSWNDFLVYL